MTDQTSYFSLRSFRDIENSIAMKRQQVTGAATELPGAKYIEFVCIVGFHHSVGSQVEYVYPPLQEDTEEKLSTEFLKLIPELALPDGSHISESGYVCFVLRDDKNTFHCTSCYRQINANELIIKDESVSRTFV